MSVENEVKCPECDGTPVPMTKSPVAPPFFNHRSHFATYIQYGPGQQPTEFPEI